MNRSLLARVRDTLAAPGIPSALIDVRRGDADDPLAGVVLLKFYAGGTLDLWDIAQLRAATGPGLDSAVEERLAALPDRAREAWRDLVQGT